MIVVDCVETLYGTNDYVDLLGAQLFALWIRDRRRELWRNIASARDQYQGAGSQYFYRSHSTYYVTQFSAVLMTVCHSWSRSCFEPHMSSLFKFKITTLWGGFGSSPQGRTVRDATTHLGWIRRAVVNLWTQKVRTNFLAHKTLCFNFYLHTERWVKSKALTASVILDRPCSLRAFARRVTAQDARRLLKQWNWERLKNTDGGSK